MVQPTIFTRSVFVILLTSLATTVARSQANNPFGAGKPAQEQAPKKALPVDRDAEQRGAVIRELSLQDALHRGRRYNVGLKAAQLLPEQAQLDVLFAEAGCQPPAC